MTAYEFTWLEAERGRYIRVAGRVVCDAHDLAALLGGER